jgi:hypothetical protein
LMVPGESFHCWRIFGCPSTFTAAAANSYGSRKLSKLTQEESWLTRNRLVTESIWFRFILVVIDCWRPQRGRVIFSTEDEINISSPTTVSDHSIRWNIRRSILWCHGAPKWINTNIAPDMYRAPNQIIRSLARYFCVQ